MKCLLCPGVKLSYARGTIYTVSISFRILVRGSEMMYMRDCGGHAKHANARGIWGRVPLGNF